MNEKELVLGALSDPRSVEEKNKDYFSIEVAASAPPQWTEKKAPEKILNPDMSRTHWRRFPVRNQGTSSTCVAQTGAKMIGIENYIEEKRFPVISARDIYTRRVNRNMSNSEGMVGVDALEIMRNFGATLEDFMPSQNLDEKSVDVPIERTKSDSVVAMAFAPNGYAQLPINDIDQMASILERGKPIMLWFTFSFPEWVNVPTLSTSKPNLRHSVTGVDYTIYNKEKCIVVEDSWGIDRGIQGQRLITEKFLKERCIFAAYIIDSKNTWGDKIIQTDGLNPKPKYKFSKTLSFIPLNQNGEISDKGLNLSQLDDVKMLQRILKYEGFFNVEETGYYGAITAKAVYRLQKSLNIQPFSEIESLRGAIVGPKTITRLNEIYAW